jgi:AcrR family transcriptional regulator
MSASRIGGATPETERRSVTIRNGDPFRKTKWNAVSFRVPPWDDRGVTASDPAPPPAPPAPSTTRPRRRDVERNQQALLDAAGAVFASSGVDAPVREVAAAAGVGVATLYRHFATRSDLVVAVYRHQIDACAEAGPELLASAESPFDAVLDWVHLFVDFLDTKHGLGRVWDGDAAEFSSLHGLFVERLVPVLSDLMEAARASGEIIAPTTAYQLLRAIGDLVAFSPRDPDYDARRMITLLVTGLRQEQPHP